MFKIKQVLLILTVTLFIATTLAGGPINAADGDWVQLWSDEFSGTPGTSINPNN
jgi:hypothetical protein